MASEPLAWWKDPRMVAAAVWIFGCAAYFYVRFTWVIVDQHGDAIRGLVSRASDAFAISGRGR